MNDLALAADPDGPVRNEDVVEALKTICAHHHYPAPQVVAA